MTRLSTLIVLFALVCPVALGAAAPPAQPPRQSPSSTAAAPAAEPQEAPADVQESLGRQISAWSVAPFIVILLGIAIIPLVNAHWWEHNLNKGVLSLLCALPILAYLVNAGPLGIEVLVEILREYYAFIVLLIALFTISGGIYVEGDLQATPIVNTVFLALGAVLASFIGTTGAAMLLLRPLLKTNSERRHKTHVFVFFIFLVANIGGSLLPVGDPPLFLGYLFGVPFFWTLYAMWPAWLTAVALLLVVFYVWDTYAYAHETLADRRRDRLQLRAIRVRGKVNLVLITGVLLSVIFLKPYDLPHGRIDVSWMQQPMMLFLALVSFAIDYRAKEHRRQEGHHHFHSPRDLNSFTFGPMIEVAVLFIGIFITMIPAICLLKAYGSESGVTHAWQFYWMTGGLSSFLDNAPTYATYFALGQGVTKGLLAVQPDLLVVAARSGPIAWDILLGISLGAVFMGSMTYIGNAPNFMVKSICEEARVKMPSFLGYMGYSVAVLTPTFLLVMAMFLL